MMQRMKGTLRPGRKAGVLALAVLLLTCVLMAGAVSATITVTPDDLADKIASATAGDVLILEPGEYKLPNGLKIEKAITLTAAEANDKPKLTVPLGLSSGSTHVGIWVAAAGVKLDNLSITSTGGSGNQNAVVFVQFSSGTDPVEITSSEITTTLVDTNAVRGIEISTQCPVPVRITGNTFQSTDSNLAATIFSNPRSGIQDVINYNIFAGTYAALVGYDPGEGSIAPDVRYNYWGPTIPDDAFPETITEYVPYYTALNDDDTIKTDSLTYAASITRDGETTYYGSIPDALNAAVDGDTIKIAAGEYELTSALTINKGVTITANDPAAKPTIKVPQVEVEGDEKTGVPNPSVTLESLNIVQTGTNLDRVLKFVGGTGDMAVKNCVITALDGGSGVSFSSQGDITFTGNTLTADGDLRYGFYMNSYEGASYTFEENIISACTKAQFGVDQKVETLSTPVDISKNYWGDANPSLDLFVKGQSGSPDLTGQNVYYTQLNDDDTINEESLHTPGIILVSGGSTTYFDTIEGALNAAVDGDTIKIAAGEYELTSALTINRGVTITANDPAAKPTLTVPQVFIAAPGVTLDNLKIQQTEGTNSDLYTVRVTNAVTEGQITITDSEILPVNEGRGFAINAGAQFDLIFTGNTVKAANEGDQLAFAIYIEAYNKGFVFEKNIIPMCSKAQLGVDLRVNEVSMDISKNYWGGAGPNLELHVDDGQTLNLAGQDTYYSRLNSDDTIDESSLVSPVEPTPVPPSYSSSSGNMDNAYRVLFNDGSTTLSVQTDLSSGDKLTKPETPVKDGYTFAGWYKDSACTQAWDFETGIPGDMTLYAKWTAAGSSGETEATATPTKTQTAVTTPQPTKTQTAAATTSAPEATTAAGVSPTLTQAPAPVAGALFGLLAAGVLLRRRFQ